mmetsp:Transcript_9774/g.11134  ORF Transcript_9774/g.11134 Transcript_9774/m.11134 type:complete len:212 (+) Transcript_9774:167-802(+)
MSKYAVVYFDFPFWRAEVPRMCFFIGGVEFEDRRWSFEEFGQKKGELPFGQLPVLYVGDKVVAQSGGIVRFAAKKAGLYSDDDYKAAKIDEVIDYATDITNALSPTMREKDEAKKMEMRKEFAEVKIPKYFSALEGLLKANGNTKYFVGDSLTAADLVIWRLIGWFTSGKLDGIPADCAESYQLLSEAIKTVDEHPKVVEWKAKHSKFYSS